MQYYNIILTKYYVFLLSIWAQYTVDWLSPAPSRVHRPDRRVFVVVRFQSVRQIMHDISEHDRINVVAENIQQHPITQLRSAHDVSDGLPFDQPESYAEKVHAHSRWHYYDEPLKHKILKKNKVNNFIGFSMKKINVQMFSTHVVDDDTLLQHLKYYIKLHVYHRYVYDENQIVRFPR